MTVIAPTRARPRPASWTAPTQVSAAVFHGKVALLRLRRGVVGAFDGVRRHERSAGAAGVPVIATPGCGLPPDPNLTFVAAGDLDGLIAALRAHLT